MITKTEYTNDNFEILTVQQVELSNTYFKHIYEDNQLKKIEIYTVTSRTDKTKVLRGGVYYLSDTEDYQTIVNKYANTGKLKDWEFYFNKQTNVFGDYSWEIHKYYKGTVERKIIEGYNAQNEMIFSCEKDFEDNDKIIGKRKYLSTPAIEASYESGLLLKYDENTNELDRVVTGWEGDTTYRSLQEFIESGINEVFDWYGNTYYHNFYPMLPTKPNIITENRLKKPNG